MIYFKMEEIGNSTKTEKDKVRKPCLYYLYRQGRTGTSLRTLDFESSASASRRRQIVALRVAGFRQQQSQSPLALPWLYPNNIK